MGVLVRFLDLKLHLVMYKYSCHLLVRVFKSTVFLRGEVEK